jgi:hypothetical protein
MLNRAPEEEEEMMAALLSNAIRALARVVWGWHFAYKHPRQRKAYWMGYERTKHSIEQGAHPAGIMPHWRKHFAPTIDNPYTKAFLAGAQRAVDEW